MDIDELFELIESGITYVSEYGPILYKETEPNSGRVRYTALWEYEENGSKLGKRVMSVDFSEIYPLFTNLCREAEDHDR